MDAITMLRPSVNSKVKKYIYLSSFCCIIFIVALAINVDIHLFTTRKDIEFQSAQYICVCINIFPKFSTSYTQSHKSHYTHPPFMGKDD